MKVLQAPSSARGGTTQQRQREQSRDAIVSSRDSWSFREARAAKLLGSFSDLCGLSVLEDFDCQDTGGRARASGAGPWKRAARRFGIATTLQGLLLPKG